jgi:competence protein ComEC
VLAAWRCGEALVAANRPRLEVRFLDVGQGDAILSRLPGRAGAVLVDGGGLGGAVDPGERVVLPALRRAGVHTLDAMAMTHPDFDHYGGLAAVVRAMPVTEFWSSGRSSRNATFAALAQALAERGVRRRATSAGLVALSAGGATVRIVHPSSTLHEASDNDASLVLLLTYGTSRVLLTGDLQATGEGALLRASPELAATTVKVPHHGSRTSSTRALVARTQPGLAIAQLGAGNRFHFPAAEVRERWRRGGARWLETARAGEVLLRSDGQLEVVATCRQDAADDPGDGSGVRVGAAGAPPLRELLAAARASWRRALSIWLKRNDSS